MFGKVDSFGIGDGPNDLPMLKVVDRPFFIKKKASENSSFIAWKRILQLIGTKAIA
jgi:predicted mannosyl-3-phosphoglycerate phosphatase (HAD superfamily)